MRYLLFGLFLMFGFNAQAAQQTVTLAGRKVEYWAPASTMPAPLLVFSHGFGGCGDQTKFLMEMLAAHGYWVFAPNHADALCHTDTPRGKPDVASDKPYNWQSTTYANRRDDMQAVLAALRTDPHFKDKIDFTKLGLIGHSLGGYTVLGLAGGWKDWQMPGVKAVLAFSPYTFPFWMHFTLGNITAPVMYQGGARDTDITPYIRAPFGVYDVTAKPKYYLELAIADHFAWTNDGSIKKDLTPTQITTQRALINAYSLAFLDHYVKGEPATALLITKQTGVSDLRYASELEQKN